MLCSDPFSSARGIFSCGRCANCRINKARLWQNRILLEAALHTDNAFVTLTYDDGSLPADGSVRPDDTRDWIKRLRSRVSPLRIRYLLCGEYGERSWRPHYHAILFGFATCRHGQSKYSEARKECCDRCELVRTSWGKGNVSLGTVAPGSAGYVCGYVLKGMRRFDDPRLDGLHPEFARMSLRPGLGRDALFDLASSLMEFPKFMAEDVPNAVQGKPLGRYLKGELRKMVGKEKPEVLAIDPVLHNVRLAARASEENPSVKKRVVALYEQSRVNQLSRFNVRKAGRRL